MTCLRIAVSFVAISAALCAGAEPPREIVDPATGLRWVLVRNPAHPGGPARMVLVAARTGRDVVIRAGDRVLVEEHTDRVDLRLEGTALGPAAAGESFLVRLKAGGAALRAVAVAHGRATPAGGAQ